MQQSRIPVRKPFSCFGGEEGDGGRGGHGGECGGCDGEVRGECCVRECAALSS